MRSVDVIIRNHCHCLARHHYGETNQDLCCEILHLTCFPYIPAHWWRLELKEDCHCLADKPSYSAHMQNHVTRLILQLDLHNLIHGVAFMQRVSCESFPPDQSTAQHSAQAWWQWTCQELRAWPCTMLVRHFHAVWAAHVTTILTEFKDERMGKLNCILSVSRWGFAVKMSTVFDVDDGGEKAMGGKINSLLAAGLFALRGAAVISQLCTEAEWQGRIAVIYAHHGNLFIRRTLGLASDTALRLDINAR